MGGGGYNEYKRNRVLSTTFRPNLDEKKRQFENGKSVLFSFLLISLSLFLVTSITDKLCLHALIVVDPL